MPSTWLLTEDAVKTNKGSSIQTERASRAQLSLTMLEAARTGQQETVLSTWP